MNTPLKSLSNTVCLPNFKPFIAGKLQTVQTRLHSLKNNQSEISENILLKNQHHYLWLPLKDLFDACDNFQTNDLDK